MTPASPEPRPESVRVVLDLDLATEGPSGRLVDEQGSVSGFFGWLQLMDGLEGVRRRAAGVNAVERREFLK